MTLQQPDSSVFRTLQPQAPDGLLSLIKLFQEDTRTAQIDLGVGVYRDDSGETTVFSAVKAAEAFLHETQATKAYLGPEGDPVFLEHVQALAFGQASDDDLVGAQTPGGTGALRLAAELIQAARPGATIWLGTPTWPNHAPIFTQAGLKVATYRHFDPDTQSFCFAETASALESAAPGDVVLLHGCCHNPTGADPTAEQWVELARLISARGLVPLIDLAYQGLGRSLEDDAASLRLLVAAGDTALVAYSCDKNFGLYRDRVGALFVKARGQAETVRSNMLLLARCLWSMPPDHGAAVVRIIFDRPMLATLWRGELENMCARLRRVRVALAAASPELRPIADQNGLFAQIPLDAAAITRLRRDHGVYMAGSGRINLAGLNDRNISTFAEALAACRQGEFA
jgi:aromatic-amino-acid transaminase